jgi:hypothetical protein
MAYVRPYVTGVARKWVTAMEDVEFVDYKSFKESLTRKYSSEEFVVRDELKELYKLLFIGPRDKDIEEYILDIIIQNKKSKVEFASILQEIQKFFPSSLRDKVNDAEEWKDILQIIERNKSYIKQNKKQMSQPKAESQKKEKTSKKDQCYKCNGDHYRSNCPMLNKTESKPVKEINIKKTRFSVCGWNHESQKSKHTF